MITKQLHTTINLDQLEQHPDNPRISNLDKIKESIEQNGFYGTIIVQESTNYILAGNHRAQAAQELGITDLPVTIIDVDDTTATKILLADNHTSDLAENADAEILTLLQTLDNDLTGSTYTENDFKDLEERLLEISMEDAFKKIIPGENENQQISLVLNKQQRKTLDAAIKKSIKQNGITEHNATTIALIQILENYLNE